MGTKQRKERSIAFDVGVMAELEKIARAEGTNISIVVRQLVNRALADKKAQTRAA